MASGPAQDYPAPTAPAVAVRHWDRTDAAIGTALVLLLISLFLPWFSGTVLLGNRTLASGTGNGPRAHGYLWIVLVLAIAALAILVARDAIARIPGNLPSPGQMLVGITGLALLLTVLGLAFRPPGVHIRPVGWTRFGSAIPHFAVSISWNYGGFVAVAVAAVAFVTAFRRTRLRAPDHRAGG
jgi:hypothetical protein